jgi:hypothetical protein
MTEMAMMVEITFIVQMVIMVDLVMLFSSVREGWVAKSVARQLATAALWVRIQTSLKNHKWAT